MADKGFLVVSSWLVCAMCVGCATGGTSADSVVIPGQAPVSMVSEETHRQWGSQRFVSSSTHNLSKQGSFAEPMRASRSEVDEPTRAMLTNGFENIRRSTDQCLARSMKRDGKVPAPKVRIQLTIRGDGKVTGMRMDGGLRGTVFGNCLRSHVGRWRFDPWGGRPIKVARIYVLE